MRRQAFLTTFLFLLLSSTTWSQQLSARITNQTIRVTISRPDALEDAEPSQKCDCPFGTDGARRRFWTVYGLTCRF
jgi:hypothetical protein